MIQISSHIADDDKIIITRWIGGDITLQSVQITLTINRIPIHNA